MEESRKLKIKVCGMREPANVRMVAATDPDYMGFIFFGRSPRYCGETATEALAALPETVTPVMVTVNMPLQEILEISGRLGIGTIQLHGDETPEMCRELKSTGKMVWKAFPIVSEESFGKMSPYCDVVDMFLLDTSTKARGGSGRKFDWTLLNKYNLPVDFMLSGGIGEGDADEILKLDIERLAGIDLNSRFELDAGIKDAGKLQEFISIIRKES